MAHCGEVITMSGASTPCRYQNPHRLEDVLVLIQALGKTTNTTGQVSESKLSGEGFRLHPQSAPKWIDVANEHPEFFRVSGESEDAVMLVCQYVSKERPSEQLLAKLLDIAVETHDREVERHQRALERELESRKLSLTKLSLVLSALTATGSMIVAIIALLAKK
jgi:hypothetical protein